MSNQLYTPYKDLLLTGAADLGTLTMNCALISNGYTFNATHDAYSTDIQPNELATIALANPVVLNGVYDADDAIFTAVSGGTVQYVVLYDQNDKPLLFIDTAAGLPVDATAAINITVTWSEAPEKIFSI